jgi:NAD(P)-dependent dehydrogenase (short-subunit alcohol dehydrogenase family)
MSEQPLLAKTILITGGARRIGRGLAIACARGGADVIIHHGHSEKDALAVQREIKDLGRKAWILSADFEKPADAAQLIAEANTIQPLFALVNNAAIFESLSLKETSLKDWDRHMSVNLTVPFLLSQAFSNQLPAESAGRIVNLLDWRALRPGADHFPYTISKAALAALTESLAVALAPRISVNALALGAILPPSDKPASPDIIKNVPAGAWGKLEYVEEALRFLLTCPAYITGEIIHVDGGRHLV